MHYFSFKYSMIICKYNHSRTNSKNEWACRSDVTPVSETLSQDSNARVDGGAAAEREPRARAAGEQTAPVTAGNSR